MRGLFYNFFAENNSHRARGTRACSGSLSLSIRRVFVLNVDVMRYDTRTQKSNVETPSRRTAVALRTKPAISLPLLHRPSSTAVYTRFSRIPLSLSLSPTYYSLYVYSCLVFYPVRYPIAGSFSSFPYTRIVFSPGPFTPNNLIGSRPGSFILSTRHYTHSLRFSRTR